MTPQERETMQMALDVLDDINQCSLPPTGIPLPAEIDEAMDSLRAALAQPPCATGAQCVGGKCERCAVQEPVAWISNAEEVKGQFVEGRPRRVWWECNTGVGQPLYTAPPQRKFIGLTDEEIDEAHETTMSFYGFARAVEAKLKEKNGG